MEIDPPHRPAATPDIASYHPTFAYEAGWDLAAAVVVVWAQRRFGLNRGRAFALYVAAYTAGRGWIEMLRIDPANHILGLRFNVWTSVLLFIAAVIFLIVRRPGPNTSGTQLVPSSGDHLQTPASTTLGTRSRATVPVTAPDEQAGATPRDAGG